jgi:hypothetical protein
MSSLPIRITLGRRIVYLNSAAMIAACVVAPPVEGAIVQYTSRPLWQADSGPISASENFNSFTFDKQFTVPSGPLFLNGFSLVDVGPTSSGNLIDVLPWTNDSLDVNGTPFASCRADFGKYYVKLQFTSPTRAFGADFTNQTLATGHPNAEALNFDIYSSNDTLLGTIVPIKAVNVFYGFIATGGEEASYMIFRSTEEGGSIIRSAWGMDNVAIAFVPEPSSALLAVSIFALLATRRSRR